MGVKTDSKKVSIGNPTARFGAALLLLQGVLLATPTMACPDSHETHAQSESRKPGEQAVWRVCPDFELVDLPREGGMLGAFALVREVHSASRRSYLIGRMADALGEPVRVADEANRAKFGFLADASTCTSGGLIPPDHARRFKEGAP